MCSIQRSAIIAFSLIAFLLAPATARLCQAQDLVLLDVIDWQADRKVVLEQLAAKNIELREDLRRDGRNGFLPALLFRSCPIGDMETRQAGLLFAFGIDDDCLLYDGRSKQPQADYRLFFSRKTQKLLMATLVNKNAEQLARYLTAKYRHFSIYVCRDDGQGAKQAKDYMLIWSHEPVYVFSFHDKPMAIWLDISAMAEHLGGWKAAKKRFKKVRKKAKGRLDPVRVTSYEVFEPKVVPVLRAAALDCLPTIKAKVAEMRGKPWDAAQKEKFKQWMEALAAEQAKIKARELTKLYEQFIDLRAKEFVDEFTLGAMDVKPEVYTFSPQQKQAIIEQQMFGNSFSEAVAISLGKMAAKISEAVDKGLASGQSDKKLDKALKKIIRRRAGYLQGIAKDRLRAIINQTNTDVGKRL